MLNIKKKQNTVGEDLKSVILVFSDLNWQKNGTESSWSPVIEESMLSSLLLCILENDDHILLSN